MMRVLGGSHSIRKEATGVLIESRGPDGWAGEEDRGQLCHYKGHNTEMSDFPGESLCLRMCFVCGGA